MSYVTTFKGPGDKPEPEDIVKKLRRMDEENRKSMEGAMVIYHPDWTPGPSLLEEAAQEIERLRRILNITDN